MKLKLTPTRISILALSAFGALIAQELVRSDAQTPNAKPSDSKFKRKSQPTPALTNSTTALPQPERSFTSTLPEASTAIATNLVPPPTPALKVKPIAAQPTTKMASAKLSPISVDDLSIDSIVAETLKTPSRSRPIPPPPPKLDAEEEIVAEASSPSLKDIRGHRAQESINDLMQRGIIQGFADGTFRPNTPINDAHFKEMVRKAAVEVPSIANLKRPKDIVTRADAAIFLHRQLTRADAINNNETTKAMPTSAPLPKQVSAAEPAVTKRAVAQTPSAAPLPSTQSTPMPPAVPLASTATSPESAELDSYTLGAGDRVRVEIFNVPEYSKDYQVLVNGTLNLHRAGSLRVAGMTLKQAERAITARYRRLLKQPIVDLSLSSARPLNVAIAGEIGRPGTYTLDLKEGGKFPTVTRLIREAGGMNRSANPRQVIVRRGQQTRNAQEIRVDLWELFQTGNSRQDLALRDGDTVFIPPADSISLAEATQLAAANFSTDASQSINVAVVGEVARPGPYVLGGGSGGSSASGEAKPVGGLPTLTQAIQQAGGIKQLANLKEVQVRRATRAGGTQTIKVDLWELLRTGDLSQDLVLQQGDTVEVPVATALNPADAVKLGSASFAPTAARINVVGEVKNPGRVEVPMNTPLNQALLAAGGFTREAKRRSVELIRLNPNGTVSRREINIDLAKSVDEQGNPLLRDGDVIVVDRSGAAKLSDTLGTILGPLGSVLPFRFIFGF